MKVTTFVAMSLLGISLSGCISMPNDKVLLTPFGVAGVHTFAPKEPRIEIQSPDRAARSAASRKADDAAAQVSTDD